MSTWEVAERDLLGDSGVEKRVLKWGPRVCLESERKYVSEMPLDHPTRRRLMSERYKGEEKMGKGCQDGVK